MAQNRCLRNRVIEPVRYGRCLPLLWCPLLWRRATSLSPGRNFWINIYDFTRMTRMRRRRMIRSKRLYDVCFRALQGLPLPERTVTTLFLESIIARLLASEQVVVCAYVWMANHSHMQLFSLDTGYLSFFHGQLKKRLTDFIKRHLGLSHLRRWDDRTTLGEVLDLEAAMARFVYSFLNPVRAGLVPLSGV